MEKVVYSSRAAFRSAQSNNLRAHPTPNRSPERLLPFAAPIAKAPFTIPLESKFAVFGDCFARNIENSLRKAELRVISSEINKGMPGNASQQTARFDIFNLDVMLQELRLLVNEAGLPTDAPLVDIGGEKIDLMIGANFGHHPEHAHRYRELRNSDYETALDADVVVLVTGGVEQWFDCDVGLYVNGFVTGPLSASYPDRYELHQISVEHSVKTLQTIVDLIRRHSRRKPSFIVTTSSASDAMTYLPGDLLIEYTYSRSVQRVAVETLTTRNSDCAYMPALETLNLSDRAYCYQKNNLSHTTQYFCDRVVADMLRSCGFLRRDYAMLQACGTAGCLVMAEKYEDALAIINAFFTEDPRHLESTPDIFTVMLNEIYTKLRMTDERARLHLRNSDPQIADRRVFAPAQSYMMALYSARSSNSISVIDDVIAARAGRELDADAEAVFQDVCTRRARLLLA